MQKKEHTHQNISELQEETGEKEYKLEIVDEKQVAYIILSIILYKHNL
jgi:hypothetical protein